MQRRRVEAPGGTEGGQLAVTVSGDGLGTNAEVLQHAQGPEADRTQGRLGDVGRPQGFLVAGAVGVIEHRPGIDEIAQAAACPDRRRPLRPGFAAAAAAGRPGRGACPTYCDPWPGKSSQLVRRECRSRSRFPPVVLQDVLPGGLSSRGASVGQQPGHVGALPFEYQDQPASHPGS